MSTDWEEALEIVDEIHEVADDVPERGEDFAISVTEKARSIGATIAEREHVTDAQMEALENMLAGLQRWVR